MAFEEVLKTFDNGVTTTVAIDEDSGQILEHYTGVNNEQFRTNKYLQNETNDWKKFDPKKEFHLVLELSMTDVMKLKFEQGIDMLGQHTDFKRLFKVIDEHYPYMKTTTARLY